MIFNDSLKFGLGGERIVAEIMRARGWTVVQVGGQHGEYQGPRIELPMGLTLVSPDLIIMKNGKTFWIEVKRKSVFSFHKNSQKITTGIDLDKWIDYLEADRYGSFPLWLFFLHESDTVRDAPDGIARPKTGIYFGQARKLKQTELHRHRNFGSHGGVFWDIATLGFLPT